LKRLVIWSMLVACILMVAAPYQASAANEKVKIVVNDEVLNLDVSPYIKESRVLVPVRGVFENLGLKVDWNQASKTATIKSNEATIQMKLGKKVVQVNGKTTKIDSAVSIKKNRLFIPIRFVVENSGADVKWNQADKTVYVTSEPTDEVTDKTKAFLSKLAQTDLNSYSADMKIEQTMSYLGEKMSMDMNLNMDMVLDPLGLYQSMSMTLEELSGEQLSTESYLTKDGYFVYESTSDQWVKYDDEMANELTSLSDFQMDPTAQFELMQRYYEDVKIIENEDTYELHTSLSGDGFQDLLGEILNLSGLGIEEDIFANFDISINKMNIVSILDKETLYPVSDSMESDMSIVVDGEEMNIVQKAENTYSNVNKLEKITIPQEVIDEAVPFEELYPEVESEM
jgi:hypothetical protein